MIDKPKRAKPLHNGEAAFVLLELPCTVITNSYGWADIVVEFENESTGKKHYSSRRVPSQTLRRQSRKEAQ